MDKENPFKIGDKVICAAQPAKHRFPCSIGAKAIVSKVYGPIIYVKENICTSTPSKRACYNHSCFKLQKKLSFKALQHL